MAPDARRGIGLCLSGGGFRATLFHPGAIQRLFDLGIATRPGFDTVSSVSGGSLTSAQWALATSSRGSSSNEGDESIPELDFTRDIARPLQALTSADIRTGALAKKFFLPWNWFRGANATPFISAPPTWPSAQASSSTAIASAPTSPATRRLKD